MINFTDAETGKVVGTARIVADELVTSGVAGSIRNTSFARDMSPAEFLEFYTGWSNGYLRADAV